MKSKQINTTQIEFDLISQLIHYPEDYYKISSLTKADQFNDYHNRCLFLVIEDLHKKSIPVDNLSIYEHSIKMNMKFTIPDILSYTGGCSIEYASKALYEKNALIKLVSFGQGLSRLQNTDDPFEAIQKIETQIFEIIQGIYQKSFIDMTMLNAKTLTLLETMKEKGVETFRRKTGFIDLDNLTGGLTNTDLIILAARPSMGKTALALNIADNVSHKVPVGIFSLEMSEIQLNMRRIAMDTGVNLRKLLNAEYNSHEGVLIARSLSKAPDIYIDDTSGLNIFELKSKAKRMKIEKNIGLIIVDYLQLCTVEGIEIREQQISLISRTLKAIAKELNIPVLALAQMNRSVESRINKKPQLSDLRESGAIEQDADVVMFLHRPEIYGITMLENGEKTENLAQIIVAKQRNGEIGEVNLVYQKELTKFRDYIRFEG